MTLPTTVKSPCDPNAGFTSTSSPAVAATNTGALSTLMVRAIQVADPIIRSSLTIKA